MAGTQGRNPSRRPTQKIRAGVSPCARTKPVTGGVMPINLLLQNMPAGQEEIDRVTARLMSKHYLRWDLLTGTIS
jgi:hypothetical protein